ncbi:TonB-dependent receptor [Segetibacter koreensis]|uniref:TonB-dependent receptor n=1 Tax=Segetibacter koreensis TaxID=398037 RepID=UPI000368F71A|nr:TonB-dependent receptor [Segetibacter koreensis]
MAANKALKKIFIFLFLIQIVSVGSAQTNRISGKVVDVESNSPIVGASIVIEQNKKGTNSDAEGGFFLVIPQDGKFNISVSSIGFTSKTLKNISAATAGQTFTIALQRTSSQLSNVTVRSASTRKETVSSLYLQQKNSSSISDGISAEAIKRSPDRSTGEVLKRVSGASVQDNKFVVIRGLSERYNTSLLNNSVLPSTEPDKKAFSFDIIPSSLIDNLVIYKSSTPDLPGDFSGGAIKVSTKDFPANQLNELSLSVGFNTLTTFKDFYKSRDNGNLDWAGFFDNKSRLIPGAYYRRRGAAFFNTSPHFKREVTKLFPNTFGFDPAYKSMPNVSFSYTGGDTKIIGNNKLGFIYSVNYGAGRRVVNRVRDEYLATSDKLFQYEYGTTNYDERKNLSALLNLTYTYGKSKLSWKNIFNNEFTKTVALRNGRNEVNNPEVFYYKSTNTEAMNNGLFNSVLEGLHSLNKGWTVDWATSYGLTYRNQPDQKILTFVTNSGTPSTYYLKVGYENSPEIRNAGRIYSFLSEGIYAANLNLTKQFNLFGKQQKLKFGTYNYFRDRNVQVDALGYGTLNSVSTPIEISKGLNFSNVLQPQTINQYNLSLANIPSQSIDYKGQVISNAGYVMLDNKFSDKVKLTWGARVEKYNQKVTAANKKNIEKDNTDVLPSLLLTYSLSNKANLRLAGSQAVNRPEFRELASYETYDYENYISVLGNPDLVRAKNTNADLKYEWFPAAGEILSASLFYKYFDKPIEQVNLGNDKFSYSNADHASAYGIEVEARKKMDFINTAFFSRLTAYANAAYIKGGVTFGGISSSNPLQGQSPYLVNGGLTYSSSEDDFVVNALYNKIGPRLRFRSILGAGLNIYEKPRDMFDVQITKKLAKNKFEIKLTISDILAQSYSWYYKFDPKATNINFKAGEDRIINSYKYGTTTTVSFKYNFK